MPRILVSACLIGQKVRYDGQDKLQSHARLQEWLRDGRALPFCPETAGGLPVPRLPAEIEPGRTASDVLAGKGRVLTSAGTDVTAEFLRGARAALVLAQRNGVRVAILKARSPSCGSLEVYDGTHSGALVPGMGVTASLLSSHGIRVFDETQIDEALDAALS